MRVLLILLIVFMLTCITADAQIGNNFVNKQNYSYNPVITNGKAMGFSTNVVYFTQPDNSRVVLFENYYAASQVTYAQLKAFIKADKTDEKIYNKSTYRCSNVAQDVHNNAERAGIDAAFVVISFNITDPGNSTTHMLNCFNTSDKGLVYIDCTPIDPHVTFNGDKTGTIKVNTLYQPLPVFPDLVPNGWKYFAVGTPKAVVRCW